MTTTAHGAYQYYLWLVSRAQVFYLRSATAYRAGNHRRGQELYDAGRHLDYVAQLVRQRVFWQHRPTQTH